jgi:hypothetical protein
MKSPAHEYSRPTLPILHVVVLAIGAAIAANVTCAPQIFDLDWTDAVTRLAASCGMIAA